jgi:hypothetical protein
MREDDFSAATKRLLAERVGHICSCPDCRAPTSGPQLEPDKSVRAGDAAHITAASPNGPRYDAALTSDQRRHADNGIWLCVTHARIIDQDTSRYTVETLRKWKTDAEAEAQKRLGRPQVDPDHSGESPDRANVRNFLTQYKKLFNQSRGNILAQVIHLQELTDLAAWRRAQVSGMLNQLKRLIDQRNSLWSSPEAMSLMGSLANVVNCLKDVKCDPQYELRLRAAWGVWSDLTLRVGDRGPQSDADVRAWQQASLAVLDASLSLHTNKERTVEEAVEKWLTETPKDPA